ncbi:glutathione S-transferase T3-like [Oryza brachyantha]|uniref:glutathione S-transferase T3-like n=1 Tax=Oryza brachyantha TaxID=4533 RepID=UPI001ADD4933|nr:glutathione S-transferase T3-like [Oryza brachyantha]XP_015690404.2 glutathione S-transferase T3-like [Oryza brachyantha]
MRFMDGGQKDQSEVQSSPTSAGTAFPPRANFYPFSPSWILTTINGNHVSSSSSPTIIPTDRSSNHRNIQDMPSPYSHMQNWGNGTHPPGGFMSYFQPNMSQNFHFVGAHAQFAPVNCNDSSPLLAETATPPRRHVNQNPISVDSDDDTDVVRTKSKLNWLQVEDVRLVSAWLNNSMDPINGNDKKAEKYWGDVAKEYNKTTEQKRWRNSKQAKERWHKINAWLDLFQGCWLKAKRTYTSGYSDQMWIDIAQKFYAEENPKLGHFVLTEVWKICRDQPKWIAYNDALKRFRKRKASDNREPREEASANTDFEEPPRPIGQKAAKKAAQESKGKSKVTTDIDDIEKLEQVQADIQTRRIKMMEMQDKLSARQVKSSKLSQVAARENRLAAKDNKEAKMHEKECKMFDTYSRLLTQDTTSMTAEIIAEHAAAIRCLRKILFPDSI